MTEELQLDIDESSVSQEEELYGVRDGILFLIDATESTFDVDPSTEAPYFVQCLQIYANILGERLSWNKQDWMGMILFGTNKWDMDPETKNILTVDKFNQVSIEKLKEVEKILSNVTEYHKEIGCSANYPLHDALWHAARAFTSVKLTMATRRVILLTCQDNPSSIDSSERHRIRLKAMNYSDINVQLCVVGLGKDWNHDCFYKDVETLSGKFNTEDYKRTLLEDLEMQVKLPSRIMARLSWKLGQFIEFGVSVRNVSAKTKYPQKVRINKETNEPLETYTQLRKTMENNYEDDENEEVESTNVLPTDVRKYQTFGGRNIYFIAKEVQTLQNARVPGIELLGFKSLSSFDPMYHFEAPKFVSCNDSHVNQQQDNKPLFAALLSKCEERGLMAICVVTFRKHSPSQLYTMIPSIENGGFYMYKIPFKEDVRNLDEHLADYVYEEEYKWPITEEGIQLCTKIIKKTKIKFDPNTFSNPKLQVQLANIEALAMDRETRKSVPDQTLPYTDVLRDRLGNLIDRMNDMFLSNSESIDDEDNKSNTSKRYGEPDSGPRKIVKLENSLSLQELVQCGKVASCTVSQLKELLKDAGLKVSGTKTELVERIYSYFRNDD